VREEQFGRRVGQDPGSIRFVGCPISEQVEHLAGVALPVGADAASPNPTATVNHIGTAIGLVGTVRHSVLIVRDGEQQSPRIAAAIAAVRAVSAQRWPASA
jgi:hypothetical protein